MSLFAGLTIVGEMTSAGCFSRFGVEPNAGSAADSAAMTEATAGPELDAAAEAGNFGALRAASVLGGMTTIALVFAAFFSLVS